MMSDVSAYNKIIKFIKQNNSNSAINIINKNPGLCERIRNSTGSNLLHTACLYNCNGVAKTIFNKKSANEYDDESYTPLYYCTFNNNTELCQFFVDNGVTPDKQSFFNAVRTCGLELIKILFTVKPDFNMLDIRKQNLLIHALKQKRSYHIVDYISNKCEINQIDIYNSTPMHYATRCLRAGYEQILFLLSKRGGDIVHRDSVDRNPLDYIHKITLKIEVADLCRKSGRFHRRRWFLMFLARFKFLSGQHETDKIYICVFGVPELYRKIMTYI